MAVVGNESRLINFCPISRYATSLNPKVMPIKKTDTLSFNVEMNFENISLLF